MCSRRRVERPSGVVILRRRSAQYWARLGSSGDAAPLTITCRTIFVQENGDGLRGHVDAALERDRRAADEPPRHEADSRP